jgi:subtilisin family serine protease
MFFLRNRKTPINTTSSYSHDVLCAFVLVAFCFSVQTALAKGIERESRHEFLVKTSSSARAVAFSVSSRSILLPKPVLETPDGDWFKVIHYGVQADVGILEKQLSSTNDVITFEPNFIWSAIGSTSTAPKDDDRTDPWPELPPRLPRRGRKDPQLQKVWSLDKVGASEAWKIANNASNIIVGVIDSGVDYNHEDLVNNIWRNQAEIPNDGIDNDGNGFVDDVVGWDFVHGDNLPWDDNGHGTHTAGTLGATGGNGVGISGVSQRASILPLKFLSAAGEGTTEDAIRAIQYAVASGARVLSNSWGGETYSRALEDAIVSAGRSDVLFVAAAGNDSSDNDSLPLYPAAYPLSNVLAVAATDRNDHLADFSNYGFTTVHLAAPGDFIWSTTPRNKYSVMSGTSMACPLVAGASVLLRAFRPELNALEIKDILLSSSDKLPELLNKVNSSGRLNVWQALRLASSSF